MRGMGTLINVGAILVGTVLGVLLRGRLPLRARETVMCGLGALTMAIGLSMVFKSANLLIPMGAVLLGSVAGELMDIEKALKRLGDWIEARLTRPDSSSTFSMGFVAASLLFCIGPMAVVGSIDDGLRGDISILAMKSVLDGFAALALASALGWGVGLSALSVLVYQGGITVRRSGGEGVEPGHDHGIDCHRRCLGADPGNETAGAQGYSCGQYASRFVVCAADHVAGVAALGWI